MICNNKFSLFDIGLDASLKSNVQVNSFRNLQ
jgi:hypothetical protein